MTPCQLRLAARVLRRGGIVGYPTEGVYGLGCDPLHGEVVLRLLALKRRPFEKGLILIGATFAQLAPFARPDAGQLARASAAWPGPVTWVLPAAPGVPPWLTGGRDSIAVRVTAHPTAAALCRSFGGALVSTSANVSGRPPARSGLGVRKVFGSAVEMVVSGAERTRPRPSEIRDASTGRVLRAG